MDPTLIIVACIGAIPPTVAILFKWRHDSRATAKREDWLENNVGRSNGQGSIVAMLENSLQWQGEHQASDLAVAQELRDGQARLEKMLQDQNTVAHVTDALRPTVADS